MMKAIAPLPVVDFDFGDTFCVFTDGMIDIYRELLNLLLIRKQQLKLTPNSGALVHRLMRLELYLKHRCERETGYMLV